MVYFLTHSMKFILTGLIYRIRRLHHFSKWQVEGDLILAAPIPIFVAVRFLFGVDCTIYSMYI